jgi:hypothetical protein
MTDKKNPHLGFTRSQTGRSPRPVVGDNLKHEFVGRNSPEQIISMFKESLPVQQMVLTNKGRRQAKKCFKKGKQMPSGCDRLLYSMTTEIGMNPRPTDKLLHEWEELDITSAAMFNGKKYDNLNNVEKGRVVNTVNNRRGDESPTRSVIH